MSKTIKVHRQLTFSQMSNTDPDVQDWFNQAFKAVGPYYKGRIIGSGLSLAEQNLLLPHLIGVEATDRNFKELVRKFYDELLTPIPAVGRIFEIGLQDDQLKLGENNLPLHIEDYVRFKHVSNHPHVVQSKTEAARNPLAQFYIEDPDKDIAEVSDINDLEDEALILYAKYKDDELHINQILTVLGNQLDNMDLTKKQLALKNAAKRNTKVNVVEQKQELQRFITVCNDPDLLLKYLIEELIFAKVLERMGTSIVIKETTESLGTDLRSAVVFLKNPRNSKQYNYLRAQYEQFVKSGVKIPELSVEMNEEKVTKKTKEKAEA